MEASSGRRIFVDLVLVTLPVFLQCMLEANQAVEECEFPLCRRFIEAGILASPLQGERGRKNSKKEGTHRESPLTSEGLH